MNPDHYPIIELSVVGVQARFTWLLRTGPGTWKKLHQGVFSSRGGWENSCQFLLLNTATASKSLKPKIVTRAAYEHNDEPLLDGPDVPVRPAVSSESVSHVVIVPYSDRCIGCDSMGDAMVEHQHQMRKVGHFLLTKERCEEYGPTELELVDSIVILLQAGSAVFTFYADSPFESFGTEAVCVTISEQEKDAHEYHDYATRLGMLLSEALQKLMPHHEPR